MLRRAIRAADPALFGSLPAADQAARQSEGVLQPAAGAEMQLALAATVVDSSGKAAETGYYVLGEDLRLRRVEDPAAEKSTCEASGRPNKISRWTRRRSS